jgi:hypothetical protein
MQRFTKLIATLVLFFLWSPVFGADFTRLNTWIGQEAGIKDVDIAFGTDRRFVAATRLADDRLKLFAFSVTGGVVEHLDSQAMNVRISKVKIIAHRHQDGRDIFLTATRNAGNRLRIDAFELLGDGTLGPVDHITLSEVKKPMDMAMLDGDRFVVVSVSPDGGLETRGFTFNTNWISHETSNYWGSPVNRVAVQGSFDLGSDTTNAIVGARNSLTGDLEVLAFGWTAPVLANIHWAGDNLNSGYPAGQIQNVSMPSSGDVITAVRGSFDEIKLIRWDIEVDNCIGGYFPCDTDVIREQDGSGGIAYRVKIAKARNIANRYVTAHEKENGNLKVTGWHVQNTGIANVGGITSSADPQSISIASAPYGRIVVAMQDGRNRLRVILYHIDW